MGMEACSSGEGGEGESLIACSSSWRWVGEGSMCSPWSGVKSVTSSAGGGQGETLLLLS